MSRAKKEIIGERFGRLVVVSEVEPIIYRGNKLRRFRCKCDCGNEIDTGLSNLVSGNTLSCGCLRTETTRKNHSKNMGEFHGTAISKIRGHSANKNNKLGVRGVYFDESVKRYCAHITLHGKVKHLGKYKALNDAIKAREDAEKKYFQPIIEVYNREKENQ
nr:MAG TPA: AP2 domain protein [Caudoviricetes sp.]